MPNFNQVTLCGHLTRDPELSYLPSQTAVINCGIAVNHIWKSEDGQKREDKCFIDFQAFGKLAETIAKYSKKGNCLLISGQLKFDQWKAKDGSSHSKHRINLNSFQFIGTKPKDARPQEPEKDTDGNDIPF